MVAAVVAVGALASGARMPSVFSKLSMTSSRRCSGYEHGASELFLFGDSSGGTQVVEALLRLEVYRLGPEQQAGLEMEMGMGMSGWWAAAGARARARARAGAGAGAGAG